MLVEEPTSGGGRRMSVVASGNAGKRYCVLPYFLCFTLEEIPTGVGLVAIYMCGVGRAVVGPSATEGPLRPIRAEK